MSTIVHFLNVGQGNMVLIQAATGRNIMFDCNITNDNSDTIIRYIAKQIGHPSKMDDFICSHRDADHIRCIKRLHSAFPIQAMWDSGVSGTTTDSTEYREYMELRRKIGGKVIKKQTRDDYGRTRLRYLSAQDVRLAANPNAQGIVIKVEHRNQNNTQCLSSAMLPSDSDAETWRYAILKDYQNVDVSSSILMAGHHGSISFFDDPNDAQSYYRLHVQAIAPEITIVSVGPNAHGHPDKKAMEFYEECSSGSKQGNKVFRTDKHGTMKLTLKDEGGWQLLNDQ